MSGVETVEPVTAFGRLEQSHWAVAKAAIDLAEAASALLGELKYKRGSGPLSEIEWMEARYVASFNEARLETALIRFREVVAAPA